MVFPRCRVWRLTKRGTVFCILSGQASPARLSCKPSLTSLPLTNIVVLSIKLLES